MLWSDTLCRLPADLTRLAVREQVHNKSPVQPLHPYKRLHIPTIKVAFTLCVARIDGVLAPVDSPGFTNAIFKPGDTLNISGTSAEVAAMPGTPHSRGLLQWHLGPWYNMIRTIRHLTGCLDAKHICIQVPDLLLEVMLWCFWLVAR